MRSLRLAWAMGVLFVACIGLGTWGWKRYAGEVFDVPMAEAHRILEKAGLPPMVLGGPHGSAVLANDPAKIVWIVKDNGNEAMRFVADLEPAGERATRVRVNVIAPTSGAFGNVAARLASSRTIWAMYVMAMEEQVASALDHREYQFYTLYPVMVAATLANMGALGASQDEANAAYHKSEADNLRKAYADERAGVGPKP